jgi:hypothetical protein
MIEAYAIKIIGGDCSKWLWFKDSQAGLYAVIVGNLRDATFFVSEQKAREALNGNAKYNELKELLLFHIFKINIEESLID